MAESQGIPLDQLRMLVQRAGLSVTPEELAALKPMFDHYAGGMHLLYEIDLDADDLAVTYSPIWNPQS